jgi:hypothetical protein
VAAALAGLVGALASAGASHACPVFLPGTQASLQGHFLAAPRTGSAPFVADGGCGSVTVVTEATDVAAGRAVRVSGVWREGRFRPWLLAGDVSA